MDKVLAALNAYGATLADDNSVVSASGKVLGVKVSVQRGRVRFETSTGKLLGSGPAGAKGVDYFIKGFWGWDKL